MLSEDASHLYVRSKKFHLFIQSNITHLFVRVARHSVLVLLDNVVDSFVQLVVDRIPQGSLGVFQGGGCELQ